MGTAESGNSTFERIVAAATREFAAAGVAGARVERIAKRARTSKERVYAHFRSKEQLYRFIVADELRVARSSVRFTPENLPDYAGRLFDYAQQHPDRHRLLMWGQLDHPASGPDGDDPVAAEMQQKLDALRDAQRAGTLDEKWDPIDVLMIVTRLATAWAGDTDLSPLAAPRSASMAARRRAVTVAIQRLFPPWDVELTGK